MNDESMSSLLLDPEHLIASTPNYLAGVHGHPITSYQVFLTPRTLVETALSAPINVSALSQTDFCHLFNRARDISYALGEVSGVKRVALASNGLVLNLIPLHGLEDDWKPITCDIHQFHPRYPGYFTSVNGPKMDNATLDAICHRVKSASERSWSPDYTFLGPDPYDTNLFAKLVKGEIEQWRIWESQSHIAFLTPFPNTPGFTVLVPRRHIGSDIFKLDAGSFDQLMVATYQVQTLLRKAFGIQRIGVFFEGYEIDYAHVKLIPCHDNAVEASAPQSSERAQSFKTYPGFITTQLGPPLLDIDAAKELALRIRTALSQIQLCSSSEPDFRPVGDVCHARD